MRNMNKTFEGGNVVINNPEIIESSVKHQAGGQYFSPSIEDLETVLGLLTEFL